MRYSLDTSSLVEPWNRSYPPDIFPSFWNEHLPELIGSADLRATQEVRVELERQDDELLAWAAAQEGLFVEVDEPLQLSVTEILANHSKLINPNTGRSGADPFVIALARLNNCVVVSEERPRSLVNPRIPDVCAALGVGCINMIQLIRDQGWSYS